jgi:sterol desaturase/sphingolipid hydroxylase (fatty acid hydroxylase superfamily)
MENLPSSLQSALSIFLAMAALAALEAAIPLRRLGRAGRAHLAPNLALALVTLGANAGLGGVLLFALARLEGDGFGLLPALALPPLAETAVALLALDLSFYVSHVAMHKLPALWRFHATHHSDPAVDVTTTLRQHPVESVIRVAFAAAVALPLGAGPGAYLVYRSAVSFAGLLEHANLRVPAGLDRALAWLVTWPTFHKVHHARDVRFTDSNYGNLVSWWDRAFGTFTPVDAGRSVAYGLDGFDEPAGQTAAALLLRPFRRQAPVTERMKAASAAS